MINFHLDDKEFEKISLDDICSVLVNVTRCVLNVYEGDQFTKSNMDNWWLK